MVSHPELGSDLPIGSDRESGCDKHSGLVASSVAIFFFLCRNISNFKLRHQHSSTFFGFVATFFCSAAKFSSPTCQGHNFFVLT